MSIKAGNIRIIDGGLLLTTSPTAGGGGGGGGWSWISFRDGDGFTQDLGAGTWRVRGPNDSTTDGWTVIKALTPSAGTLSVSYAWTTTDSLNYDWPFYYLGFTEPTNANVNGVGFRGFSPGNIVSMTPQSGIINIPHGANAWIAFGVYSEDTCCGPGNIDLSGLPGTLTVVP